MATILDIVKGLNQAAVNAGDYGGEYDDLDEKIGLKREEGNPIIDSRVIDGFKVRFAADKMIVTYQSEVRLDEVHPRQQFENEINRTFGDIVSFLKKEYKKITKNSVTLTEDGEANITVQSTSRVRNWVEAQKQYSIGNIDGDVISVRRTSKRSEDVPYEKKFKDFLELSSDKRPDNDKAKANPETPGA